MNESRLSSLSRLQFYGVVITPGAVLMALEIVSSRILAPHFGSSVYVWGSIIGVFLAAMSVGYLWGGRLADRQPNLAILGRLILAAAVAQVIVLLVGSRVVAWLGGLTGGSPTGTLLTTAVLFGPVTICLAAVSPYAVRLATRELEVLGGTAGHLYALSTGGSLAGTLGATFVLVPRLDLESILRLLLAITALTSLAGLISDGRRERLAMVLAGALLLFALIPGTMTQEAGLELLADRITPYQTLRVNESDGIRFLHSDGTVHAAVVIESGEPWLDYARMPGTALMLAPEIERFLILGMGGGSVGTYLRKQLPELHIDYVDIDPAVAELAREFMFFEEDERSAVFIDDGRRFLTQRPDERWDFVYVDTYIGHSIPFHLSTVEFFGQVKSHLNPGGVLGVNLIANLENPFVQGILRSVQSVFRRIYVFAVPAGNYLMLATDDEQPPGREELLAAARRLDPQFSFDPSLEKMAERLRDIDLDLTQAPLLTDRFAPVNHLVRMDKAWDGGSQAPPADRTSPTSASEQGTEP
ncbi:MAG: fused MFS/spermidine synthase [Acidobacteriota bacterium]